ncbi:hypothetical protein ACFS5L_40510 [Streptomyces phyllanthi]|uniref:Permease n=1 Tax=Streptomyces phyllanthi TaxID=1803180 RepID=A0A5N8VY85_9ACTN|nr:hypothetical protein [Streptomyces phyllanthi]MPY38998.1 hypothetical protein [Streptomyces phyllanthi]
MDASDTWTRQHLAASEERLPSRPARRETRFRHPLLRPVGLAAAAAMILLTLWALLAADRVPEQRESRTRARTPVILDDRIPGVKAEARWFRRYDEVGDRNFEVLFVEPARPTAEPPPGLSRWPAPGEAFVSPALLAADPAVRTRYGRLAGEIGPQGLADADEWLVYARSPSADALVGVRGSAVTGFATPVTPPTPDGIFDTTARGITREMRALIGVTVLPASLVFLIMAALSHRPSTAGLRASVKSAFGPVACGVLTATAAAAASTVTDTRLPIANAILHAEDLAPLRPWLVLLALGTALVALTVVALLSAVGPRTTRGHDRHDSPPGLRPGGASALPPGHDARRRAARLLWFAGTTVTIAATAVSLSGPVGEVVFFTAVAATWITAALILQPAVTLLAGLLSRKGKALSSARLDAAGRLLARPLRVPVTVTAGVVVLGVGLLAHVQVWQTPRAQALEAARATQHMVGSRLLMVSTSVAADTWELDRFRAALPNDVEILPIVDDATGDSSVLHGTCSALAALGPLSEGCPGKPDDLGSAFKRNAASMGTQDALRWFMRPTDEVMADREVQRITARRFLILSPPGAAQPEEVRRAAYAFLPAPMVERPGDLWIDSARPAVQRRAWMGLLGLIALMLLVTAGLVRAAARPRSSTFTARVPVAALSLALTLPLALASAFAALLAGWLGSLHGRLKPSEGLVPEFLPLCVSLTTLVTILVALMAGATGIRRARRPTRCTSSDDAAGGAQGRAGEALA